MLSINFILNHFELYGVIYLGYIDFVSFYIIFITQNSIYIFLLLKKYLFFSVGKIPMDFNCPLEPFIPFVSS